MKAFLIGFFTTLLICAGLAWLGGYKFDYCSGGVATGAFLSIYASVLAGIFAVVIGECLK